MTIYQIIRKTENWDTVKLEDCRLHGLQLPFEIINEWNSNFKIPWLEFRSKVAEMSRSKWTLPVLENIEDIQKLNDDDVIIPIDDDDWLHSDIEQFVKQEIGNNDILQWTQILNTCTDGKKIERWGLQERHSKAIYGTIDHSIKAGVLKQLSKGDLNRVIEGHGEVIKFLRFTKRRYFPAVMSCYNRHIGSITVLRYAPDLNHLINLISAPRNEEFPTWANWSKDAIEWLDNLSKLLLKND